MLSKPKLLEQAKARWLKAKQSPQRKWKEKARDKFKFVAGDQWPDADRQFLESQKRPVTTFNLIAPNLKAVTGMEQGNRQELRYIPREKNDTNTSDVLNQVAKWIFDTSDAEFEISEAFRDMLICGMGWTQIRAEFDEDPEGMVKITAIDPMRKWWDPASKKHNLIDRRYDFTEVDLDKEEFESLFPNYPSSKLVGSAFSSAAGDDFEGNVEIENRPDNYVGDESVRGLDQTLGKFRILEYNYFRWEKRFLLTVGDAKPIPVNSEQAAKARKEIPGAQLESLGSEKRYYRAWFNGENVVDHQLNADPRSFTDHCITGELNRTDNTWLALVDAMMDPQLWANKMFSQILHTVNTNTKGGVFAFQDSFTNPKKAQADYAKPDAMIFLNQAKGGSIRDNLMERTPAPYPQAMGEILNFTMTIIPRVTGINLELLGLVGRDQPGILEAQRKQAGMTILAPFFDSLRHYRIIQGRSLIHFIKNVIGAERIARIVEEEYIQHIPLIFQSGAIKYDIHAEESPHSPNQKALNLKLMTDMLQFIPEVAAGMIDLMLPETPLSARLVEEMVKRIQQNRQPDPMAETAQQLALGQGAADIDETISKTGLNKAKTEKVEEETDALEDPTEDALKSSQIAANVINAQANLTKARQQPKGKDNGG